MEDRNPTTPQRNADADAGPLPERDLRMTDAAIAPDAQPELARISWKRFALIIADDRGPIRAQVERFRRSPRTPRPTSPGRSRGSNRRRGRSTAARSTAT